MSGRFNVLGTIQGPTDKVPFMRILYNACLKFPIKDEHDHPLDLCQPTDHDNHS